MTHVNLNSLRNQPDERGRFGMHGGRFVAETLMPLILKVEAAYKSATTDADGNAKSAVTGTRPCASDA